MYGFTVSMTATPGKPDWKGFCDKLKTGGAVAAVSVALVMTPFSAAAISGGGKDYASKDWSGADFSKGSFVGKDFSGAIARGTNFRGADLRGARFFKADLREADFTGSDLRTASLEGASLKDAIFVDAVMESAYLSDSILEAGDLHDIDASDALMPEFVTSKLCKRSDVSGTNAKTKVDTRESLMCD
mmetsp:Transcript_27828/g.109122  ORF Transcript_27828/g.109122 Transcript_27828/m.109122 type:complete len:187 (-) Transcript_27828:972-1532(-)|eukprot:CAMPEP_0113956826 /NCGR_PEP_ID=MMETSP0011_2-20120614/2319_1 /TAXON_ID=101924 /ORGANISM="Rhodosorus marinus" /LENGTH=186 /DNA_ID=CAMNT_0000967099 /DNA_START=143 /DNA_END=703 /DNA_ORIENTATION=- /assembly_acc=CAM_ASM_000156